MKFIGAAQQQFDSFLELASYMLDTHCHNWNDPSDPRSYILQPVCSFENADKSDEDIELIKRDFEQMIQAGMPHTSLAPIQRPINDRCSDSGEFLVFNALWTLVQDKVQAPFLAIHGLNLNDVRRYLQQIFPHAPVVDIEKKFEVMMREYDFVLIGPKIGLIVIEVKSSRFMKETDFDEKNNRLPDDIVKALEKQLDSFDPSLFQVCSGIQITQEIPVRKVLFTPNLKKARFETWINKLDDAISKQIMEKFDGVTHWFSEDMDNKICSQKPLLYTTLRKEIEKTGHAIPHEIFESYGLIISGLRSAVVLRNRQTVSTHQERLSASIAILKEAAALESHNPRKQPLDVNAPNVIEIESKLVLLTPEQQATLNGPNRQFIIGAPGTGKTIILQAKVDQSLNEGKKVLIYAEQPYDEKYKQLFGSRGSCEIRISNQQLLGRFNKHDLEHFVMKMSQNGTLTVREYLEKLSAGPIRYGYDESMVPEDLQNFDAIFIDDAFDDWPPMGPDWKRRCIYASIFMMAMAGSGNSKFQSKLIWITCDAFLNDSDDEAYQRILNQIIRGEQGDCFNTAILDRVMRSSESVYRAIYSPEVTQRLAKNPVIGHKIHGFYDSVHLRNLSLDDTRLEIWKHAHSAVIKFKEDGFDYGHMAILIGGDQSELRDYLKNKFWDDGIPVGFNRNAWPGLTLDDWRSVSSFEWPVVIYIGMLKSQEQRASAAYNRYRACSRATMNLFEITAHVKMHSTIFGFRCWPF